MQIFTSYLQMLQMSCRVQDITCLVFFNLYFQLEPNAKYLLAHEVTSVFWL